MVQKAHADKLRKEAEAEQQSRRTDGEKEKLPDITMATSERATFLPENDELGSDVDSVTPVEEKEGEEGRDRGGEQATTTSSPCT